MERVPPQGAPGACVGPCFYVVFAFLAWPCTGSPKVPSGSHSHCHTSTITSRSHWTLRPLYCRSIRRWKDTLPGGPAYSLSCELDDFSAVIYTKENVAAKALADQISDLSPPTLTQFGRLLGRIEEGNGEAYATKIDVRCNGIIATKRILIATGGSATAEMYMRYSNFIVQSLACFHGRKSAIWQLSRNSCSLLS